MSRLLDLFSAGEVSISDLVNPSAWMSEWAGGRRTTAGEMVSASSALGLSAYYACLRNISEDVAKLPAVVYERVARGKNPAPKHPLYRLVHDEWNPGMSAFAGREVLTHYALAWGGGVAEIVRDGMGVVRALYPIHPSRVRIRREAGVLRYFVNVTGWDGDAKKVGWIPFDSGDLLHLHGLGPDGHTGYSVLSLASETIGLGLAAQRFGAAFFGNGTQLGGVLQHPQKLGKEALAHLREFFNTEHQGPDKAWKPAILEEGMEWKPTGIPPRESQFLESREFGVEEIARWFRMPPHKIGHLNRATFANIEHQGIEYVTDTLMPWLVRWEQEYARKLFPTTGPEVGRYFVEHVVAALMRGDYVSRTNGYRIAIASGWMKPNEARELENMNPAEEPEADGLWVQGAMLPMKTAAKAKPPGDTPPRTPGLDGPNGSPPDGGDPGQNPEREESRTVTEDQALALADISRAVAAGETTLTAGVVQARAVLPSLSEREAFQMLALDDAAGGGQATLEASGDGGRDLTVTTRLRLEGPRVFFRPTINVPPPPAAVVNVQVPPLPPFPEQKAPIVHVTVPRDTRPKQITPIKDREGTTLGYDIRPKPEEG